MNLPTQSYAEQLARWPQTGRHILAHYDDATIVVYQAYRAEIGAYALQNQAFGGAFSYSRMSWIKPNYLWMMYRSGWATKPDQDVVLGIRLRRAFFNQILQAAVASSYDPTVHATRENWSAAVANSDVRLQWDPDHAPSGEPVERRAIQLGLRGETLRRYGREEIVEIIDMSELIAAQRAFVAGRRYGELLLPVERVYG